MDEISDYYRRKEELARRLREELLAAKAKVAQDLAHIRQLERQLDLAEYVGD